MPGPESASKEWSLNAQTMTSGWKLTLTLVVVAFAQLLQAQQPIAIYELSRPDAQSATRFGAILNVRALSSGKLLVNDGVNKQVMLLDATLSNATVVVGNDVQVYGAVATAIIPYRADSTLFVDRVSRSLLVIDPTGKVVRTFSPVRAADMVYFSNYPSGADSRGNLIYRGPSAVVPRAADGRGPPPITADTVVIMRANFETRVVDTLTRIRMQPTPNIQQVKDSAGKEVLKILSNPWMEVDEWTVLSDGTVVVMRGHDYHADFIDANKRIVNGPRVPFDFRPLNDGDKQRLIDSITIADSGRAGRLGTTPVLAEYIPVSKIPDYYPTIRAGALKPDLDGNVWVLPNTSARSIAGELVYDVINSKGVLLHRVRLPKNKSIAGFGSKGVVYLMSKDGDRWLLERTRVVK